MLHSFKDHYIIYEVESIKLFSELTIFEHIWNICVRDRKKHAGRPENLISGHWPGDGRIQNGIYRMGKLLARHIDPGFTQKRPPPVKYSRDHRRVAKSIAQKTTSEIYAGMNGMKAVLYQWPVARHFVPRLHCLHLNQTNGRNDSGPQKTSLTAELRLTRIKSSNGHREKN